MITWPAFDSRSFAALKSGDIRAAIERFKVSYVGASRRRFVDTLLAYLVFVVVKLDV